MEREVRYHSWGTPHKVQPKHCLIVIYFSSFTQALTYFILIFTSSFYLILTPPLCLTSDVCGKPGDLRTDLEERPWLVDGQAVPGQSFGVDGVARAWKGGRTGGHARHRQGSTRKWVCGLQYRFWKPPSKAICKVQLEKIKKELMPLDRSLHIILGLYWTDVYHATDSHSCS